MSEYELMTAVKFREKRDAFAEKQVPQLLVSQSVPGKVIICRSSKTAAASGRPLTVFGKQELH